MSWFIDGQKINMAGDNSIKSFFRCSELIDYEVLRPLSHIHPNWELSWDADRQEYTVEGESYAWLLNSLIAELEAVTPPARYHDNEDRLAEHVIDKLKWTISKRGTRWEGADYSSILEQGGFSDSEEKELIRAAAGRIHEARARGQKHFDEMEESHRRMLAAVLSIILFHRSEPPE